MKIKIPAGGGQLIEIKFVVDRPATKNNKIQGGKE